MIEKKEIIYKNPFPVTAVANFYNNMQNNMIVETGAIQRIKEIVDKWILDENDGITVAVQGEYGTGKTQMAIEIQRYFKKYDEKKYHFICLDSPTASFLELYKNRFLNELTKVQVLERLDECYFQIIIKDMMDDEIYKKFIHDRKNVKSIEVIERFGLAKSKYDLLFEKKLESVTKNVKFVPALLLLLEPRFEKEVWEWFNGAEPSEAMKERGVKFTINNDTFALETIGIFAFLFSQQGHTFILFIDEMEKIVSNTERIKRDSFEALKKLIETVKATKSMLILCGLPDYYVALPEDTQQRIAYQVKTEKITLSEIEKYICNANEEVNEVKTSVPFSKKNLEDILDISNGNIRAIIRLLYHSGNWYIKNNTEIDEKAFGDILINAYGSFEHSGIKRVLSQIFISKGWIYEENKSIDNVSIDFWLPSLLTKRDSLENGIEIYIIQNVLSEEDFKNINDRMFNKTTNCKICIVEGFINDHFYKSLASENRHVFRYRMPEFNNLFISVIEGEKAKCENSIKQNDFSIMNEKIEQLSRYIRRAINDINENSLGKHEFYNFMRHVFDIQDDDFYVMPDKDSDFYLLINEIHKVIDNFRNNKSIGSELGVLYLIKEFSYILYYLSEKPQKLVISIDNVNIYEVSKNFSIFINFLVSNCGSMLNKITEKFQFILGYMCYDYEDRKKILYRYKEDMRNIFLLDMSYEDDFFLISNRIKKISQNFCAELLIKRPEILENYEQLFVSFYYFIYVIEPAIVRREFVEFDVVIIREYYDLLRKYFRSYKMYSEEESLEYLFENYERNLRRMIYEREY